MSQLHRVELAAGSLAELGLGLVALIQRFDALVNAFAPPCATASAEGAAADPVLDLLLGLVAVRVKIQAQLDRSEAKSALRIKLSKRESWLR